VDGLELWVTWGRLEDMKENNETDSAFESQSSLMDADGQILVSVKAQFSPKDHYGSLRLPVSADPDQILSKAASLKTSDGRQFRLSKLRRCPAVHLIDPHMPHLEFDYGALN
jgi:hypothetical protein